MPLCCQRFTFPMQQSKNVPQKHIINITYFSEKQHYKTTEDLLQAQKLPIQAIACYHNGKCLLSITQK